MLNVNTKWVRGERITKGSCASIFLATSHAPTPPSQLFAVKSAHILSPQSLAREHSILEKLVGCDEIIKCYGQSLSLEFDTTVCNLVLEFAPGGDLLKLANEYGGILPESKIREYTKMILKGLSFMHKRKIVHCDLKLENILVFPSGQGLNRLKIADFGLAKDPEENEPQTTYEYNFRGTPMYMSPESVKHKIIRPALDIWSLGCLVIEMMSGYKLWDLLGVSEELKDLHNYLVSEKRGRFLVLPANISDNAKDFLNKCLEWDYKKRWTADMLLNHPFITDKEKEEEEPPL